MVCKPVAQDFPFGWEGLSGSWAVFIVANVVWLIFFPFLVLKTGLVGCVHFESTLRENGEEASAPQPVATGLVFERQDREESAVGIVQEDRGQELDGRILVVGGFLGGGISHEDVVMSFEL